MTDIYDTLSGPWIVAGDFNVIFDTAERLDGAPPNMWTMEEFNDVVFNCILSEIDFDGLAFIGTKWNSVATFS